MKTLILFVVFLLLLGCAPQRPPLPPGVVPEARPVTASEEQYGHQVLSALSEQYPLDYNHPRFDAVIEVVDKLTSAAQADKDPWHVYLFDAPRIKNAAATRGNHVFVWSGLLNFTKDDTELATILAHEIAHVLAGHTDPDPNEEIKKLLINIGAVAVGVAASRTTGNPYTAQNLGNIASSLTSEVGKGILINPYSRERELEADQIGLFMMADAKFDPEVAIKFWHRVQNDPDFGGTLSFFSSHPPPADRLSKLQSLLPQARARFQGLTPKLSSLDPRTPLRSNTRDTFNWSGTSNNLRENKSFRVASNRAILYEKPSTGSKKIGEFAPGAEIIGREVNSDFVEISSPDHGYLQRQLLVPK